MDSDDEAPLAPQVVSPRAGDAAPAAAAGAPRPRLRHAKRRALLPPRCARRAGADGAPPSLPPPFPCRGSWA
jgi:hypothetical protein